MNNTVHVKGDYKIAVEQANAFIQLASKCKDNYLTDYFYTIPVLLSFAAEVYMKAIMIYDSDNDEFLKGHDLQELFNNLSEERKTTIESKFNENFENRNLKIFLNENKDTFETWRYPFEKQVGVAITELGKFAEILQSIVLNLPNKGV